MEAKAWRSSSRCCAASNDDWPKGSSESVPRSKKFLSSREGWKSRCNTRNCSADTRTVRARTERSREADVIVVESNERSGSGQSRSGIQA